VNRNREDAVPPEPVDLADLADLLRRSDPVPPDVVAGAERAGVLLAHPPERLLPLVTDSAVQAEPVGVRGESGSRTLEFVLGPHALALEITPDGPDRLRALGVVSPAHATVRLRHPTGEATAVADEHGCLWFVDVPSGPLQLVLEPPDDDPLSTEWFVG